MTKTLEHIRKSAFWVLDALQGGGVRKHFNELKIVQANPNSTKSLEIRTKNLNKVLEHAVKTVPFYSKEVNGADLNIKNFPIIDKQLIRDNFESFRSSSFKDKHNHEVRTSGSTGNPFILYHDKNKRDRNTADTLFFAKRAGFELGTKLYYLRLWDKQYQKNKLLSFVQNISTYSVDELDDIRLEMLVKELLKDTGSVNILAYSSALDTICSYLDKNHPEQKFRCRMDSVIAMAEALAPDVKEGFKKYFNAQVVSRYSNSENGIFAQQGINTAKDSFEINWASYHIEILDLNEDRPAKYGEVGRVVITDYFNYAMPMIRYDTGDVAIMDVDQDNGNLVLSKIDGRKMDMFTNTKGEYISSHIIHHVLQYDGIEQFQFIEELNNEYVIKLKMTRPLGSTEEDELVRIYSEYFGHGAKVTIEYVDHIPLLPSGKRKLVINNAIQKPARTKKDIIEETDTMDLVS